MNFKTLLAAIFAAALSCTQAFGQATILPPGETCFQANVGTNGMVGTLGTITGGSGYTNGTYGGVSLTGGSGSGATANITVSGGVVTAVTVLNPGVQYVTGDVLSASAASIGGTGSGFSVPVASTAINSSLAGGSVGFYVPNTQTFKQTWQDAGEQTLNQNPVPLDANGCAVVYGSGVYTMTVFDSLGNTVYTKLTASTGPAGVFWAGQAAGTPNAITISDASFAGQDGTTIQFLAVNANSGPTTVQVSGGSIYALVNDTSSGPAALSGGEIAASNTPMITFDATNQEFHLVNPASTTSSGGGTSSLTPPQGYLNLVGQATGDVIQTGDVVAASTLFYSPYVGNTIPIWNGSSFKITTISELTMTLTTAGSPANTIQDACVFSNNGVPTLVLGPSWQTVTAGAGSRGTGAGTAQISRLQGIWVNANAITGYNGLSSYSIPASQCTYVGSISVDSTAGQVSAYRTYGQSRKFGVWNAYNRVPIIMQAGDPTSSWVYNTSALRAANGNSANSIAIFTGLPEEQVGISEAQTIQMVGASLTSMTAIPQIGIGLNSTSAIFSSTGELEFSQSSGSSFSNTTIAGVKADGTVQPLIGINNITALETSAVTGMSVTYFGTVSNMILKAQYRG